MALSPWMTQEIVKRIKPRSRIAAFGYPDIIAPPEVIEKALSGRKPYYRTDSESICKRHGLEQRQIPDAHSFFEMQGAQLDVYDIVKERGCEILIDLNHPIQGYDGQYDFILDVGTLEHCFNIGRAAFNMAAFLKVGGFAIHENPFNWGNHGFYGLCPTWYTDFYEQNGFKLHSCLLIKRDQTASEAPRTARFRSGDGEFNCFAVAERIELVKFKYPTQTKYKKLLG